MTSNWTNLHNHSVFSMLDGHGKLERYAERAKELGHTALAITDHGNVHGWLDHYDACKKFGIKPILGLEAYQARKTRHDRDEEELSGPAEFEHQQRGPYHLTVLARNLTGYKNLIQLSSRSYVEGYYRKPRIDFDLLQEHRDGLIIGSGCLNGILQQALLRGDYDYALEASGNLQSIVGKENFFAEVQDHGLDEQARVLQGTLDIAKALDAPIIPTGDCHYVYKEDHEHHDVMLCQPPGTLITTTSGVPRDWSQVPIEQISKGDRVVSWDSTVRRGTLRSCGRVVTKTSTRHYAGRLVTIETNSSRSSYTSDHICVARLDTYLPQGDYVVYLMRRDNQYRIGVTKYRGGKAKMLGFVRRAKDQDADAIWILSVHPTLEAALLEEAWTGYRFQIPTLQYQPSVDPRRNTQTYIPVSEFWNRVGDNSARGAACLEAFGRDSKYPIWEKGSTLGLRRPSLIRACNLLTGMLVCDVHDFRTQPMLHTQEGSGAWRSVDVSISQYDGLVYSIEVDHDHTYIADGIVTHNCVGTGALVEQEKRFRFSGPEFYLKSYAEMAERFDPLWLQNSMDMAERVDVELNFGELYFPEYPDVPEGMTAESYLEQLVWEGLKERYGDPLPQVVIERALHEMGVVNRMGFPHYFLVVWDIVNWAKRNDIRVGFGRGSAAGCILSYALRITGLDPIRLDLKFERFLVEGRKSMPDIDLDFDDRFRPDVIAYARERYGSDRVANIVTFSTIGAKSAIQDAGRVLGYEFSVRDKLSKMVPTPILGVMKNLEDSLKTPELKNAYETDEDARKILDAAKGLEGLVRQPGIHAAGVVIGQGPISNFVPVMQTTTKAGGTGPLVTQWDMNRVDQNGLLKIDFLGLRNLGVIDMTIKTEKTRRDQLSG